MTTWKPFVSPEDTSQSPSEHPQYQAEASSYHWLQLENLPRTPESSSVHSPSSSIQFINNEHVLLLSMHVLFEVKQACQAYFRMEDRL